MGIRCGWADEKKKEKEKIKENRKKEKRGKH
jgi:hypothetical protein